ncbi:TonB family protein [Rhodanobacter denitrificans]|uniref:M56 family metallopeptidase n=1 Tax=Rhodanobacter denitrificans TaxID=666685 RepID=UPI000260FB0B|nr:TonB family protein [Rhodanobacter denitrificans]EIM02781.1 TonB family protein [Rhodanobacter denitrificans]UJM89463.1 TonB family protein [Rhodanobacter denitrificans]
MDAAALRSLLLVTAAIFLVLLVRRPLRRGFGAGPAFTLWLLPPLMATLPWIPTLPAPLLTLPSIEVLSGNLAMAVAPAHHGSRGIWLASAWLPGVLFCLLRLVVQYLKLHRHSRPLPEAWQPALRSAMGTLNPRRLRLHPAGPAVLWAPRSLLLLPPDFMQRFGATERRLVLRHELTHLRRGDALWNLLAELAGALLWFHPLMWLALPRFRLDQELACDERVLRHSPQDEAGYAQTLLHSAGMSPAPALIPWLAEPQLKERLTMIQRHRPGALRRRIGCLALATLMAGGVFVVQASTGPSSDRQAESDLTYNAKLQPRYPAPAIKNNEQGTVLLTVQVHADGTVGTIAYDPKHSTTTSADLIAAASDAARQWHFNPQMKDGKPVDGYARVPVKFDLTPLPDGANKD